MIRLDIGCGSEKADGFVGVDRVALPHVDLVADLGQRLPFKDNSVDFILASHTLEHLNDLQKTMKEIYRVCRHGALVCIVAPYSQQGLNFANPFHKQSFNEHTPRFWTTSRTAGVDSADYYHPHADGWGLAESDHSKAEVDFRCLRMEFFYFPEYRYLSPEKQREARKKYLDVCDQIMYHLMVVKTPTDENQLQKLWEQIDYYEPPYVTARRLKEQTEVQSRASVEICEAEIDQIRASLRSREVELEQSRQELARSQEDLRESQDQLVERNRELDEAKETIQQIEATLQSHGAELDHLRSISRSREIELQAQLKEATQNLVTGQQLQNDLQSSLAVRERELDEAREVLRQLQATLESRQAELDHVRSVFECREIQLQTELKGSIQNLARVQELQNSLQLELDERVNDLSDAKATIHQLQGTLENRGAESEQSRMVFQSRETELRVALDEMRRNLVKTQEVLNDSQVEWAKREIEADRSRLALQWRELELERGLIKIQQNLNTSEKESLKSQREVQKMQALLQSHEAELKQTGQSLAQVQQNLKRFEVDLVAREEELTSVMADLKHSQRELDQTRSAFQTQEKYLDILRSKAKRAASELDLFRHLRVIHWVNRFYSKPDLRDKINPAFQQLMDDSFIFTKQIRGFRLQSSMALQRVPHLDYFLDLNRPNLTGIFLAPILDLPPQDGELAIEILSPSEVVVARSVVALSQIDESVPTRFDFSPIQGADQGRFWLRVYVLDADVQVRLFEWRKYKAFGLGPLETRPFCGFIFKTA